MQLVLIRPAHTHLWIHKPASLTTRYVMGARWQPQASWWWCFFFFSQKIMLSKECNSVTSNLTTRDILLHYSCIVAGSYCGLHKPYDMYAGSSYRLDSPTSIVFFPSHTLSAILLVYRATSWCTFGISWSKRLSRSVSVSLLIGGSRGRQHNLAIHPPFFSSSSDMPRSIYRYHI